MHSLLSDLPSHWTDGSPRGPHVGAWGQVPEAGSTVTRNRLEIPQPHQTLQKPDHFPKLGGGQEATRWQRAQVTSQNRSLPGTYTQSAPSLPHWETGRDEVWIEISCQKHTAEPFCLRGLSVAAWHTGVWERQEHLGAEGVGGHPRDLLTPVS